MLWLERLKGLFIRPKCPIVVCAPYLNLKSKEMHKQALLATNDERTIVMHPSFDTSSGCWLVECCGYKYWFLYLDDAYAFILEQGLSQ